jgi:hypothetical protein
MKQGNGSMIISTNRIKLKSDVQANVVTTSLNSSEMAFSTDTARLVIGHDPSSGNINFDRDRFPQTAIEILTEVSPRNREIFSQQVRNQDRTAFYNPIFIDGASPSPPGPPTIEPELYCNSVSRVYTANGSTYAMSDFFIPPVANSGFYGGNQTTWNLSETANGFAIGAAVLNPSGTLADVNFEGNGILGTTLLQDFITEYMLNCSFTLVCQITNNQWFGGPDYSNTAEWDLFMGGGNNLVITSQGRSSQGNCLASFRLTRNGFNPQSVANTTVFRTVLGYNSTTGDTFFSVNGATPVNWGPSDPISSLFQFQILPEQTPDFNTTAGNNLEGSYYQLLAIYPYVDGNTNPTYYSNASIPNADSAPPL